MARYQVLETSFIGSTLVEAGKIVDINDDPNNGGMRPGSNLAKVDDEGNLEAASAATEPKRKSKAKAAPTAADEGGDLA